MATRKERPQVPHPTATARAPTTMPRTESASEDFLVFSRFFINRPIFASVLSIVITLGGTIALFTLPVAQYPDITPPTVEVSASYPGANANAADYHAAIQPAWSVNFAVFGDGIVQPALTAEGDVLIGSGSGL